MRVSPGSEAKTRSGLRAALGVLVAVLASVAAADTPADYEAAARDALARGDCTAAFRIGQRFRAEHAGNPAGYWFEIAAAVKPPCKLQNDADLKDVAQAIRELRRRKLEGWDHPAATTAYQLTFQRRAKLARAQGDFPRAIVILEALKDLGDPRSQAAADIDLSAVYLQQYTRTNKRADAIAAREATQAALRNRKGLAAQDLDEDEFLGLLNFQLGVIEYELGNQKAAVAAFELAAQLNPSDPTIAESLEAARAGGKRRWLSLHDVLSALGSLSD